MLIEFMVFCGSVGLGSALSTSLLYFLYRRGLATRMWLSLVPTVTAVGVMSFFVGKFGTYDWRVLVTFLAVTTVVVTANLVWMGRHAFFETELYSCQVDEVRAL